MRLIGVFEEEKRGLQFYSFLQGEKISAMYEIAPQKEGLFQVWVIEEGDVKRATHWFKEFQENPEDSRFISQRHPIDRDADLKEKGEEAGNPSRLSRCIFLKEKAQLKGPLTRLMIFFCIVVYIWNQYQASSDTQKKTNPNREVLTPLFFELSYDAPFQEVEFGKNLGWEGLYSIALKKLKSQEVSWKMPLFVKIRQGDIWRLFTPVFIHLNLTHIFFNLLFLAILGVQVEGRIKPLRYFFLILMIGMISNTFQYLMSGPFFMGSSGIVCGLAGFIWMRQWVAPWEGYPFQKGLFGFLGIAIVGMAIFQSVIFFLGQGSAVQFPVGIGNTAHLSGAVTGMILGRIPFFYKEKI